MNAPLTKERILQHLLAERLLESLRIVHDQCCLGLESSETVNGALALYDRRRAETYAALLDS